jgi:DNA mismatch endonuclease (patch repair protein)
VDVFTKSKRSEVMSKVRSSGTKPEGTVQVALRQAGYRIKRQALHLDGSPDFYLPREKVAVFVHGCFWHQHAGCRKARRPASNQAFWNAKLDKNIARDRRTLRNLRRRGISCVVVWECQLNVGAAKIEQALIRRIEVALRRRGG